MLGETIGRRVHDLIRQLRVTPGLAVFVGGYLAILFWFKIVDVYHNDFATAGILTTVYNGCRALYIFYLFWIIYQVGNFVLTCIAKESWKAIRGIDRVVTGFFAGTGI